MIICTPVIWLRLFTLFSQGRFAAFVALRAIAPSRAVKQERFVKVLRTLCLWRQLVNLRSQVEFLG